MRTNLLTIFGGFALTLTAACADEDTSTEQRSEWSATAEAKPGVVANIRDGIPMTVEVRTNVTEKTVKTRVNGDLRSITCNDGKFEDTLFAGTILRNVKLMRCSYFNDGEGGKPETISPLCYKMNHCPPTSLPARDEGIVVSVGTSAEQAIAGKFTGKLVADFKATLLTDKQAATKCEKVDEDSDSFKSERKALLEQLQATCAKLAGNPAAAPVAKPETPK
jgi:hypothetical protein